MLEGDAVAGGQGSPGILLKHRGGGGPQLHGGELRWWLRHIHTRQVNVTHPYGRMHKYA